MKQSTSILVLFVIFITSSTSALSQKARLVTQKSVSEAESAISKQQIDLTKSQAPVVIAEPEGLTDGNGVFLRWHTEQETGNLGFYVYRLGGLRREQVGRFVSGSALRYGRNETANGEEYSLYDPDGTANTEYVVESVELNGHRTQTAPFFAKFTADISAAAGASSEELVQRSVKNPGSIYANSPIFSKDLQIEMTTTAPAADPNNQHVIAATPGVKIGVKQNGMYRVTRAQLQAGGFNVSSDPSLWQLYTDGVQQAIIVGGNGDYIDFYGKGIDTVESDTRIYYLIAGQGSGLRMSTGAMRPSFGTVKLPSYDQDTIYKERFNYVIDILNGSAGNFFGDPIFTGFPANVNFNLTAVDTTAATARVLVRVQGDFGGSHTLNLNLNGHVIGQLTGAVTASMFTDITVPASFLVEGQNSLVVSNVSSGDTSFFDSVEVLYKRRHVATQNQIAFTTQNLRGATIQGFSSANVRLFDITTDGSPIQLLGASIVPDGGTFDVNIPAYRARSMFAVEDSGLLQPSSVTMNTPSTLSTTNHNANLVIISYKDFMTQANAWADYRRAQGFSVEVVNVEDVYDEFNYGVLSAQSMKDFLFFAKNNWQTPPQYVLLIGDATYDPRDFEGRGNLNLLPAMLFDSLNEETASDDAIVDFNNDGLAELAIGRIPAKTTDMVTNALSKTMSFEQLSATQNFSRGVLFAYEYPLGYDFMGASQQLASQLPAGTTSVMVGMCNSSFPTFPCDPNGHNTIVNEINNGRYLVNFAGHGSTGVWVSTGFYSVLDAPQLSNANSLSIFTMLTCLNGYFINTTNSSLAETLLNSTTGGAVASWASTGTTTPDVQSIMATRFYNQISAGNITKLGDLIVDAKTVVPGGRDVRLTWVLLGDPMLKVR